MAEIKIVADTEFLQQMSVSSLSNSFQDFQETYNKINKHIASGHRAEIQGNTNSAIRSYSEVLRMIEHILSVDYGDLMECSPDELSQAKEIKQKISQIKEDVSGRLQMLKRKASHSKDQPSEVSVSPKLSEDSQSDSYFLHFDASSVECGVEATEIFTIPDAIQMLTISAEGTVTASDKLLTLHVVKFDRGSKALSNGAFIPPAFLQVGEWFYPLMPGLSPALITKYRAYVFPDVLSDEEGAAVAIVLPASISKLDRMRFEVILDHFTVLNNKHIQKTYLQALSDMEIVPVQQPRSKFNIASIISFLITVAASLTAWVITTGALVAIWLVQLVFRLIRSQIQPVEEPSTVHPSIRQGVTYIKTATTATVKVKQYVVDKLGESTMSLALTIAPMLKEQGEKVLPEFLMSPNNEFVKGTIQITTSTVKGMTMVCKSVDTASLSVMNNLTRESFYMIQHRFGEDVGTFASETLSTAQCMVRTARSARNMNLARFAVRAGKPQGRAVLQERVKSRQGSTDLTTLLTPAVFLKANNLLHNSTQTYVKILETFGQPKQGVRRRSSIFPEMERRSYRRASVDGVIRPKSGKMTPYCPVHTKSKLQEKRFSLPTTTINFDADTRFGQCKGHKSAHNLLSRVLSVNEAVSNVSSVLEYARSNSEKLQANTIEKFKAKYQAIEEDAAARAHTDLQNKINRRRGSLYRS